MGLLKVDLTQFGITAGSFSKDGNGHYSAQQYTNAYNNGVGIQNAIDYARDNGYSGIILPKNTYSVCYSKSNATNSYTWGILYPRSNQEINLGGSKIEVIFDSTQKSPYHTHSEIEAWKLSGAVFVTLNVQNVKIHNGVIKGDIYNRSFSDGGSGFNSEKGQEQTYGIHIFSSSYNIEVANLDIHGFMGDSITMSTRSFQQIYGYFVAPTGQMITGYIKSDGTIIAGAGAFYSENIIAIDRTALKNSCPLFPNLIQLQTGGGYTRIPDFIDHYLEVALYKSDGSFIEKRPIKYLDKIVLPKDATGLRLQLINQTVGTTMAHPNFNLTQAASSDITIRNCKIHDNHRGGISNASDNTLICNNEIYNNGMDSGINAPTFPDSTRYQINFEDTVSNNVIIRDNNIYQGIQAFIIGSYGALIENNNIHNVQYIINIGTAKTVVIRNNELRHFVNILIGGNSKELTTAIIEGNQFYSEFNTILFGGVAGNVSVYFNRNIVRTKGFDINTDYKANNSGKVYLNNNYFYSRKRTVDDAWQIFRIVADEFFNNTVEFEGQTLYNANINYGKGGFNKFKNITINNEFAFASVSYINTQYNNDIFINSQINSTLSTGVYSHKITFNNCQFDNTVINAYGRFYADRTYQKSVLVLNNCTLDIYTKNTIRCDSQALNQIEYKIHLKDCTLNYMTTPPKLVIGGGNGKVTVVATNTTVNGNPDFINKLRY